MAKKKTVARFTEPVSVGKLSGLLSVDRRKIERAIKRGDIPAPEKIRPTLHLYTPEQAEKIAVYFGQN